jgi:hypothetical protein
LTECVLSVIAESRAYFSYQPEAEVESGLDEEMGFEPDKITESE